MQTTVNIQDLVALKQSIIIEETVTLPMDHYELEQLIEDLLFEGAIATRQRLEGHEEIIAIVTNTKETHELNRDELMRLNILLNDIDQAVA